MVQAKDYREQKQSLRVASMGMFTVGAPIKSFIGRNPSQMMNLSRTRGNRSDSRIGQHRSLAKGDDTA
jgi:hypothetical protein